MPQDASVLFIMLDATRADRLSAWGNPHPTTPTLDGLAAAGALFRRHFANSHATRPSFPQLMTGRYYFQNVLRAFTPNEHPREFPFSQGDPTAAFLPAVLRARGFQTLGVSAHPWFVAASDLGRQFDRLELVEGEATRGHADARDVVDRAAAVWRARDRSRPVFLYVHFMDMHMPRYLPDGEPRFPVAGYDWRRRFKPNGEPRFHRERRRWLRADARDFGHLDRRPLAAVYDSRRPSTTPGRAIGLSGPRAICCARTSPARSSPAAKVTSCCTGWRERAASGCGSRDTRRGWPNVCARASTGGSRDARRCSAARVTMRRGRASSSVPSSGGSPRRPGYRARRSMRPPGGARCGFGAGSGPAEA